MALNSDTVLRSRAQPPPPPQRSDSPLYNPNRNKPPQDNYDPKAKAGGLRTRAGGYSSLPTEEQDRSTSSGGDDFLALNMGGANGNGAGQDQFMQMQLMDNQNVRRCCPLIELSTLTQD